MREFDPVLRRLGVKSLHYRAAALLSALPPISRPRQDGFNAALCAKSCREQVQQHECTEAQFTRSPRRRARVVLREFQAQAPLRS